MTTSVRRSAPPRKLGYQPGLDGLRALSVLAVVAYHADLTWLPGGFLGVEVFFVVSGFLITSLLLEERHRSGAISLRDFWARRARRLLPALYLLLIVVSVAALLVYRDAAGRMGGDVVAALAYVSNWWQIFLNESYFAQAGRPPLLQHLWSLAVEEQFYLLFPPLFALAVSRFSHRRVRIGLLALAVASAVEMAILFDPGTDPSRVYYGTDTRASGLLLGALLAMVWTPWRSRQPAAPGARATLNVAGVAGLALVAWFFLRVNAFDPFIYRGGFFLLDLVCLVVIAVVVHPAASLSKVLAWAPLQWIGLRSYSIYLWHWPIFMVTRPGLDTPLTGLPLLVLRLGLTVGAAELSYRYVEQPLRRGAIGNWWRDLRASSGVRHAVLMRRGMVLGGGTLCLVLLLAVGLQRAATSPEREELELAAVAETGLDLSDTTQPPTTVPVTTVAATTAAVEGTATTAAGAGATTVTTAATTAPPATTPQATNAVAVGDSVMLGAASALRAVLPGIYVDAKVARQFTQILQAVQWYVDEGKVPGALVVHAGTNGVMSDGDLDALSEAAGDRKVVLVNAKVERPWQDLVNQRMAAAAERHANIVLVDWHGLASQHPEWFAPDGAHLRPDGQRAYAQLIHDELV